jgi:hypothetical protein
VGAVSDIAQRLHDARITIRSLEGQRAALQQELATLRGLAEAVVEAWEQLPIPTSGTALDWRARSTLTEAGCALRAYLTEHLQEAHDE